MASMPPLVANSPIDAERFGIRSARAHAERLADLDDIEQFCARDGTAFLILRAPSTAFDVVQEIEHRGGRLMDTLVYYSRKLQIDSLPETSGREVLRESTPADREEIGRVARSSFSEYFGHYHADPRLDRGLASEGYASWAERSAAEAGVADVVFLAEDAEGLLGFATLRMNGVEEGEGVLFAVSPRAQGRGIYRDFMIQGMRWCAAKGASRMVVSTQITNLAVQKVWSRLGFEPSGSIYTFHRWFDDSLPGTASAG